MGVTSLGIKEFTHSDEGKEAMDIHLEGMQIILGEEKTKKADKLAGQICSTIPKCMQ